MDLGGITLPDNMYWADEWAWDPGRESVQYAASGSLVAQVSTVIGGRPITLEGMWVTRAVAQQLKTLAESVDQTHALTLPGGATYTVMFRRNDGPPVEVSDIWREAPDVYQPTDYCTLIVRLREASSAYIG